MAASRRAADAGFVLIEALVALALLAIGASALLRANAEAARRFADAEAVAYATLHAQSVLAAAGVEVPLAPGLREGRLPDGLRWRLVARPLPEAGAAWRAMAVDIVVLGAEGRLLASLETVRLAARPGRE